MVVVPRPFPSATRSMYRGDPLPRGMGQIASNRPAGWIRRMGSAWSNPGGVTTQAWPQSGKYARTASARRPDWSISWGPSNSNGFSCLPSINRPICSKDTVVCTRTSA